MHAFGHKIVSRSVDDVQSSATKEPLIVSICLKYLANIDNCLIEGATFIEASSRVRAGDEPHECT